jgi:hypothetical protein
MNPTTKSAVIEALEACVWRLKSYDYQAMEGTIAKGEAALALLRSEPEPTPEQPEAGREIRQNLQAFVDQVTYRPAEPTPEPGERERFEAWVADRFPLGIKSRLSRHPRRDESYHDFSTDWAWIGWQARAPLPTAPEPVAGWQWVPKEPTDLMESCAKNAYEDSGSPFPDWKDAYRAMLAAAPTKGTE